MCIAHFELLCKDKTATATTNEQAARLESQALKMRAHITCSVTIIVVNE